MLQHFQWFLFIFPMLQPHTVVNQLYQQTPGHHLQVYYCSHNNPGSSKICITLSLLPYFCIWSSSAPALSSFIIPTRTVDNYRSSNNKKLSPTPSNSSFTAFAHHHFVCSCTRCTTRATRAPTRHWRLVLRATRTTSTTSPTSSCKLLKTKMLHRAKCWKNISVTTSRATRRPSWKRATAGCLPMESLVFGLRVSNRWRFVFFCRKEKKAETFLFAFC